MLKKMKVHRHGDDDVDVDRDSLADQRTANATQFSDDSDDEGRRQSAVATLQSLVTSHLTEVTSVDGYRCPKCCGPSVASSSSSHGKKHGGHEGVAVNVSTSHLSWPKILVIHLKRFNFSGEKILSSFVPPDILHVPAHNEHAARRRSTAGGGEDNCSDDTAGDQDDAERRCLTYRKVATVEHEGSTLESGHYTATVLNAESQASMIAAIKKSPKLCLHKNTAAREVDGGGGGGAFPAAFVHCDDDFVQAGDGNGANAGFCLYVRV
jgi:hypothetical protein